MFPILRTKSRVYCSVPGCKTKKDLRLTLSFHHFPQPNRAFVLITNDLGQMEMVDRLEAWKRAVKIENPIDGYTRVCSLHFEADDYFLPGMPTMRRRLKATAVPHLKLPDDQPKTRNRKTKKPRKPRGPGRPKEDVLNLDAGMSRYQPGPFIKEEIMDDSLMGTTEIGPVIPTHFVSVPSMKMEIEEGEETTEIINESAQPQAPDQGTIASQRDFKKFKFFSMIRNEEILKTVSGIPSYSALTNMADMLQVMKTEPEDITSNMTLEDKVLLTFCKIKQDFNFDQAAVVLKTEPEVCERIFFNAVPLLSSSLRHHIAWPIKEEDEPEFYQFKGLDNVKVFVHCSEVLPRSNDSGSVMKTMIGVSLDGSIVFISEIFNDSLSDTDIFEQSGIISLLQPGDAVMAGESFQIDDFCKEHNVECVRPVSLKKVPETELEKTIIEATRLVKRTIRKFESFEMFRKGFESSFYSLLHNVVLLVSVVINMCLPITDEELKEEYNLEHCDINRKKVDKS